MKAIKEATIHSPHKTAGPYSCFPRDQGVETMQRYPSHWEWQAGFLHKPQTSLAALPTGQWYEKLYHSQDDFNVRTAVNTWLQFLVIMLCSFVDMYWQFGRNCYIQYMSKTENGGKTFL